MEVEGFHSVSPDQSRLHPSPSVLPLYTYLVYLEQKAVEKSCSKTVTVISKTAESLVSAYKQEIFYHGPALESIGISARA
jgi:hypothetical protein